MEPSPSHGQPALQPTKPSASNQYHPIQSADELHHEADDHKLLEKVSQDAIMS
jgi:hypothetical protein